MADPILANRVMETSTTTGTGTFTLAGAVSGYRSFTDGVGDGVKVYYTIVMGTEWEVGIGTFTLSGTTLSRTTVLDSSNAGALVSFSAGTKNVFVTIPPQGVGPMGVAIDIQGAISTVLSSGTFYFQYGGPSAGKGNIQWMSSSHAATPGGSVYGNVVLTSISAYEPHPLFGTLTTTNAPGVGSWYFQPFTLPLPLAAHHFNGIYASYFGTSAGVLNISTASVIASNTTGGRSATQLEAWTAAYYRRGSAGSSSQLERITSNTWGLSLTQHVSVSAPAGPTVAGSVSATVSYLAGIDASGSAVYSSSTYTAAATTNTLGTTVINTTVFTSAFSRLMNMLTGLLRLPIGFGSQDLSSAGNYWAAVAYSSSQTTAGSACGNLHSLVNNMMMVGVSSMPHRQFGQTVSNTSSQYYPGWGVYSAASASAPNTVQFTQIRSIAGHLVRYMNFNNTSF